MFYDLYAKAIIESNDVELYEYKSPFNSRNGEGAELNHFLIIRSTERKQWWSGNRTSMK